jgi:glutamate/tyrosine decarboxylase-like PLP-dependent enzyme
MKLEDTEFLSDPATLDQREAPLAIHPDEFRRLGYSLVDEIADFLCSLPARPVTPAEGPQQVREILGAADALPEEGTDPGALLSKATTLLFDHSLFNGHPRFWGYVTSSAAPIGALGDFLASAVNPNVGAWKLSPIASEIEAQSVRWVADLIGYPTTCGGLLVSGGNMANFAGFLAARTSKLGGEVRTVGIAGTSHQRIRVYASEETHTWIQKAVDLFGFGTDSIRWISTDSKQRLQLDELRKVIEADRENGDTPFLVVGTAGTVSTGAVDPLVEMAEICREYRLWFHVDGAYGGIAAQVPGVSRDLRGLNCADSVAVDPHKWLYAPLEAGCVFVRHPQDLLAAFSYSPPYYHFGEETLNYFDVGLQNSRGFRALKVWLALQQVGRTGYMRMIAEDIQLAKTLDQRVKEHRELESVTQSLSITTFRYVPQDLLTKSDSGEIETYLNKLNEELLLRIEKSGEAFISNAIVDDKFVLRLCIVNFRTSLSDIEALPELVVRLGRQTDALLRSGAR